MLDMELKAARASFFDTAAVASKLPQARRRVLSRQGAFLRKTMQRLMRYRQGPSAPGSPPHAHPSQSTLETSPDGKARRKKRGALLREMLYFVFDPGREAAVVGPVRLGGSTLMPVPELLNEGGTTRVRNRRRTLRKVGGSGEIRTLTGGRDSRGRFVGQGGVVYARLETQAQAERANRINEELYGPLEHEASIAPRPFTAPALTAAKPKLAEMWKDSIR